MNKELYISLISRQLSSELNTSQLQNLNSWLSKSKDNANLLSEFKQTWDATASYKQTLAIDVDSSFASFKNKFNIPTSQTTVLPAKPSNLKRNLLLALLLLLLLSMGAIYISITSDNIVNDKHEALQTFADSNTEITLSPNSTYKLGNKSAITTSTEGELTSILNSKTQNSDKALFYGHKVNSKEFAQNLTVESMSGQAFVDLNDDEFKFIGLDGGRSLGAQNASFNIQNYADDNMTVVDVQSGKVMFFDNNGEAFVINEGQRAIYDKTTGKLLKAENPTVNPFKWHKGILVFNDTPLNEAFLLLERFYGVNIDIDHVSSLENKNFTATFPISSDLDDCLQLINTSFKMDIERLNTRTIKISNVQGE